MSALAASWAMHLAHALWQATIAGAVILAIVRRFGGGASPRLRHALLTLALVKFVLPPMLPLPTGLFSAAPPVAELRIVRDAVNADPRLLVALMLVHLGGIAVALARLARGAWWLRAVERSAERGDGFLITDAVAVPMTTGRAILVPRALHARLGADELQRVLEHEREHLRRGDVGIGVLHSVVAALWWFHPFVHALAREARNVREECCDDAVIARHGDRAAYTSALLRAATFAASGAPAAVATMAESPHALLVRIRRIASPGYAPSRRLGFAAVAVILVAALLLLPGLRVSRGNRIAFDHATRHALHH